MHVVSEPALAGRHVRKVLLHREAYRCRTLPALAVLVAFCACRAPAARQSATVGEEFCGGSAPAAMDAKREQELLKLMNERRKKHRLPVLRVSLALADAARLHARDMARDNYLEHDSFDRTRSRLIRTCAWSERVQRFVPEARYLAENIASGTSTAREVVETWMDSPAHRRSLLGASFSQVGVGYWAGGDEGGYWVADFAGDP